jgi:hypothetical protein
MADNDDDDDFRQQPQPVDDYDIHKQIQDEEHLDEDYGTPASEPDDAKDKFTDQHPVLDDRRDIQEVYDEGEDDAAVDTLSSNVSPKGTAILGYDPKKDERKKKAS